VHIRAASAGRGRVENEGFEADAVAVGFCAHPGDAEARMKFSDFRNNLLAT
jgi:hypothetical protein